MSWCSSGSRRLCPANTDLAAYLIIIRSSPDIEPLCPHAEYPVEDERRAEQEPVWVATERILHAMDMRRCLHNAIEVPQRQHEAGAVYTTPIGARRITLD